MIQIIINFFLIGAVSALLGVFYRNCLKVDGMIFNCVYRQLNKMVENVRIKKATSTATIKDRLLASLAYPLGYCMYCNTTWISLFLALISMENIDSYCEEIVALATVLGVQHTILLILSKWVLNNHPVNQE